MIYKKCPGQDLTRKPLKDIVYEITCPNCGYKVEFFFDDKSRLCPHCKTKLEKSDEKLLQDFGCASWCSAAEECLGPRFYSRLKAAKDKIIRQKQEHLRALLKFIPAKEKEVKEFFVKAFKANTDLELFINPHQLKPLRKNNPQLYEKVIKYFSEYSQKIYKNMDI